MQAADHSVDGDFLSTVAAPASLRAAFADSGSRALAANSRMGNLHVTSALALRLNESER
jgi:hypothetical protein